MLTNYRYLTYNDIIIHSENYAIAKFSWIRMVSKMHKLKKSEVIVLKAITFLTHPISGIGSPRIKDIEETIKSNDWGDISYGHVMRLTRELSVRKIIEAKFIRRSQANLYRLLNYYILSDENKHKHNKKTENYMKLKYNQFTIEDYKYEHPDTHKI